MVLIAQQNKASKVNESFVYLNLNITVLSSQSRWKPLNART